MTNEFIIERLFSIFKEKYEETVCDRSSVFDGQRDLLELVMGLSRILEKKFFDIILIKVSPKGGTMWPPKTYPLEEALCDSTLLTINSTAGWTCMQGRCTCAS